MEEDLLNRYSVSCTHCNKEIEILIYDKYYCIIGKKGEI